MKKVTIVAMMLTVIFSIIACNNKEKNTEAERVEQNTAGDGHEHDEKQKDGHYEDTTHGDGHKH